MTPRKLLVLGATRGIGLATVSQALEQGHHVTAFARNADKLQLRHDRLRAVTGDTTGDVATLADAMAGQDAVISAIGAGQSFKSHGVIARSMPVIIAAMQRAGVRRLIFTSGYGVGATAAGAPLVPRLFFRFFLKDIYADKAIGEEILRKSDLDWTLVYPAALTDKAKTGRYRAGERLDIRGMPKISRADTAEFLLRQVEDRTYVRKGVVICY